MNNAVVLKDVLGLKAGDVMKYDPFSGDYIWTVTKNDNGSEFTEYKSIGSSIVNNNPGYFEVVQEAAPIDNSEWNNALLEVPATIEECIKEAETLPVYQKVEGLQTAKSYEDIEAKVEEYVTTIDNLYDLNIEGASNVVNALRDKISALEWVLYGE